MNLVSPISSRTVQCLVFAAFLTVLPGCKSNPSTAEQPAGSAEPVLHASIDAPAPGAQIKNKFIVGGWAFATGGVVQEISVFIDGKKASIAALGGIRPDVAQQFPEPAAAKSGWNTEIDASPLAAGKHDISVKATLAGGSEKTLGTVLVTK